jgi:hypothetical protein
MKALVKLLLLALASSVHLAFATPVLFRGAKASCSLTVDGEVLGQLTIGGFLRAQIAPGQHVLECTGTFQWTGAPAVTFRFNGQRGYGIEVRGDDQVVFDLSTMGRLVMSFSDVARSIGPGWFQGAAQYRYFRNLGCGPSELNPREQDERIGELKIFPQTVRTCGDDPYVLVESRGQRFLYLLERFAVHTDGGGEIWVIRDSLLQ